MKTIASRMFTIAQGNPWNLAQAHTVQEFGSPEHRGIASSNADNKFNLAIDEENINFNISGVPNAMVKRSHGVNVHNLIQRIENHPQRQALQSDLQRHRAKNQKIAITAAGNTELCEIVDVEPKSQHLQFVGPRRTSVSRLEVSRSKEEEDDGAQDHQCANSPTM